MSTNPRILVTGAAGKTGSEVVEQLRERGFPVRALVRQRDERSARLEELGAEVQVGDLLDPESMRAAMQGVRRVYFVYPPQGELLVEATTIVAVAARDAGVDALVNMSLISARRDAKSPLNLGDLHSAEHPRPCELGRLQQTVLEGLLRSRVGVTQHPR